MKYYNLATINSEQEIFDLVARHLLTQKHKSMNPDGNKCAYRDYTHKFQCAAGIFISNADYGDGTRIEGKSWFYLTEQHLVNANHKELIIYLQRIHDLSKPAGWNVRLRQLAAIYKLNTTILN